MVNDIAGPYRSARRRSSRRTRIAAAVGTVGAAAVLFAGQAYGSGASRIDHVTVQSGDTLWGIATAEYGSSADIRARVADIESINNVSETTLEAGQVLAVPAP